MRSILIILLFIPGLLFSQWSTEPVPYYMNNETQEKRLALVIGNANYDKGLLNNPINDALLIAKTLNELNFEVMFDTNIVDHKSFLNIVKEFGNKRYDYDVAFIYYAGHGVQVGSENYLLATQEVYESEYDVQDYGINVLDIMRYLTDIKDKVNIIVLDACRDNPFEMSWNNTRSLKGGGLAKMSVPNGSLIAFSTDAGKTASDGDGKNSVYCQNLAKNMLNEELSITQVFQQTRLNVSNTNLNQSPVENSKLTGDFYLVESDFGKLMNEAYAFIGENKDVDALEVANKILTKFPNNSETYCLKGNIYSRSMLRDTSKAFKYWGRAIYLDSTFLETYIYRGAYYQQIKEYDKAIKDYNTIMQLDPTNAEVYNNRGCVYDDLGNYDMALEDYSKAIELNPEMDEVYNNRGIIYEVLKEYHKALEDYAKSIELNPESLPAYYNRGTAYRKLEQYDKALDAYTKAIEIYPHHMPYRDRGKVYYKLKKYDKALEDYDKAIDLHPEEISSYNYMGTIYTELKEFDKALDIFYKAIEIDPENINTYTNRGTVYKALKLDVFMCLDFQKACDLGDCEMFNMHCK